MDQVRMGVIGTGGMGQFHCGSFKDVRNLKLTAVCDIDPKTLEQVSKQYDVPGFSDYRQLLDSKLCDAVVIATPHYFHPEITIAAFEKGLHVLVEKPVGVYTLQAEEANQAHARYPHLVYSIMFQMRTVGYHRKMKELIESGEIGRLTRVIWINTDWFRTQAYYDSGGWRATWSGEGGGVIINQSPHSLDQLQWLCGLPRRVRGFVGLGKTHQIEVEDEVTAYLEWENGATGIFMTSSGEAPGTNRVEICGTKGKLTLEAGKLIFSRNRIPFDEFIRENDGRFASPECWKIEIPPAPGEGRHIEITQNFVNAILHGEKLISPGEEGIRSLSLGNAMLMSGIQDRWVDIPFDGNEFKSMLDDLCANSKFVKKTRDIGEEDMNASFH